MDFFPSPFVLCHVVGLKVKSTVLVDTEDSEKPYNMQDLAASLPHLNTALAFSEIKVFVDFEPLEPRKPRADVGQKFRMGAHGCHQI